MIAQTLKMNSGLRQILGRVKKKSSIPAGIKKDAKIVPTTGRATDRGGIAITAMMQVMARIGGQPLKGTRIPWGIVLRFDRLPGVRIVWSTSIRSMLGRTRGSDATLLRVLPSPESCTG